MRRWARHGGPRTRKRGSRPSQTRRTKREPGPTRQQPHHAASGGGGQRPEHVGPLGGLQEGRQLLGGAQTGARERAQAGGQLHQGRWRYGGMSGGLAHADCLNTNTLRCTRSLVARAHARPPPIPPAPCPPAPRAPRPRPAGGWPPPPGPGARPPASAPPAAAAASSGQTAPCSCAGQSGKESGWAPSYQPAPGVVSPQPCSPLPPAPSRPVPPHASPHADAPLHHWKQQLGHRAGAAARRLILLLPPSRALLAQPAAARRPRRLLLGSTRPRRPHPRRGQAHHGLRHVVQRLAQRRQLNGAVGRACGSTWWGRMQVPMLR